MNRERPALVSRKVEQALDADRFAKKALLFDQKDLAIWWRRITASTYDFLS